MEEVWYTVSQAAGLLQLHEKTVQRFIREGKLSARKVGRSYRIDGHELSTFAQKGEKREEIYRPDPEALKEKPVASAVIDCFIGNSEQAMRISNSFNAVMRSEVPEDGQGRYDFVYFAEEGRGKLIFHGSPFLISRLLVIADELLGKGD
ncbi:MAG: helix-turn-helix domain-containing protein [Sphaerochaetaceae bacterium]